QPWRVALALVDDAFKGEAPLEIMALFRRIPPHDLDVVGRILRRGFNVPPAHGLGRYFDAFGALLLDRPYAAYEGQVALELNMAADPAEQGRYPYEISRGFGPWQVDLRH